MKHWTRRDWLILLGLTILAAALRFYKLGVVPPGFQFDEAYNAIDAAQVLAGQRPLFLPPNGGREVVYTYLQAGLAALLGLRLYTLRLVSALAGIATIPVTYVLLRRMLAEHGRRIAAFTSLAIAISFWHLHFSHYGIRVILMPLVFSGVCGFFWLGERRQQLWPYLLGGLLAGFSVWVHPTGRLIPFVLAGYLAWRLWAGRRPAGGAAEAAAARRSLLVGTAVATVAAVIVFLPLGLEFYRHPDFFFGHASKVSVFALTSQDYTPAGALLRHILAVIGMFDVSGDQAWIHNLAGRPVFDLAMSIPFLLGLWLWGRRLFKPDDPDRDALVLFALWSAVMLLPSVFSDMPPNFSRTLPALPAVFVAVGLGLDALAGWGLKTRAASTGRDALRDRPAAYAGAALAVLIVLISGGLAFRDYFFVFPAQEGAYYNYDVDKLDAWRYVQDHAAGNQVYMSQLWGEHATIAYLRGQDPRIKSLDTSDTVVLPAPGLGALYIFPAEQHERAVTLASLWPSAVITSLPDRYGKPLIDAVQIPAADLQSWPPGLPPQRTLDYPYAGGPTLAGLRSAGSDVYLYWQAGAAMPTSYTSYLHLVDGERRRVAQVDKLPGNGSYPTTAWTAGERVIERYHFSGPLCLSDGPLQALAGWYDLAAGSKPLPRAGGGSVVAPAGDVQLAVTSYPTSLVRDPNQKELPPTELDLLRYTVQDSVGLQAGAPLAVDLYWRGGPAVAGTAMTVTLAAAATPPGPGETLLWQGTVVPQGAQWTQGEALCRHLALRLPAQAPGGAYRLDVWSGARPGPHGAITLNLAQASRRFDAPVTAHTAGANLGDQVRLAGYDVAAEAQAGRPLPVSLAWQALAGGQTPYTVFVHLLDPAGKIVAQSDAAPAGGYTTDRWVAGEYVVDKHVLDVPAGVPAGTYRLVAGMYDPVTGSRLTAVDGNGAALAGDVVPLGTIAIK